MRGVEKPPHNCWEKKKNAYANGKREERGIQGKKQGRSGTGDGEGGERANPACVRCDLQFRILAGQCAEDLVKGKGKSKRRDRGG